MIKLIESNYDRESGCSYVKIETELGNFEGYAWLNDDEDKDIESAYFGCELAESRALLMHYSRKRELLGHRLDALYRFRTDLKKNPQYNGESFEVEILNRRIDQMEKQNRIYKQYIHNLKDYIHNRPIQRCEMIKSVHQILDKKKEKQDKE